MEQKKESSKSFLDVAIDTMAAIFTPVLPVITAAGILKALILLFASLGVLPEDSSTYYVLSFISDAGFYFLPVLLGFSTAKHFNGNPYLAAFLCAVLFHPDFAGALEGATKLTFLSIPIGMNSYQSAVIPAILAGWAEAVIENFFRKWIPDLISFFAVPLLTTVITAPLILIVLGPSGTAVGDLLCGFVTLIHNHIGWPAVAVLAALCPIIVTSGTSLCFLPLSLATMAATGFDPVTRPAFLAANSAMAASALAVFIRSKFRNNKSLGLQTSVVAYMGITEPAIYGVLIPLKRPYIASIIAAFIGGAFAGITGVKAVAYASPSLITIPIFISDTFIFAILTLVITSAASFILTLVLGFEEVPLHDASKENS